MSIKSTLALINETALAYDIENKDDIDDLDLYLFEQAQKLKPMLSMSEQEQLAQAVASRFCFDSLNIMMMKEEGYLDDCEMGLFFLMSQEASLEGNVDLRDIGLSKWEQLEDNDWGWFYDELLDYGLMANPKFYYLLKINNQDLNSETNCYCTITVNSREEADKASIMYAQAFYSGEYDSNRGGFTSCDGEVLNQDCGAEEISESEMETLRRLSIGGTYNSLEHLEQSCNMDEVEEALAD